MADICECMTSYSMKQAKVESKDTYKVYSISY